MLQKTFLCQSSCRHLCKMLLKWETWSACNLQAAERNQATRMGVLLLPPSLLYTPGLWHWLEADITQKVFVFGQYELTLDFPSTTPVKQHLWGFFCSYLSCWGCWGRRGERKGLFFPSYFFKYTALRKGHNLARLLLLRKCCLVGNGSFARTEANLPSWVIIFAQSHFREYRPCRICSLDPRWLMAMTHAYINNDSYRICDRRTCNKANDNTRRGWKEKKEGEAPLRGPKNPSNFCFGHRIELPTWITLWSCKVLHITF